MKVEGGLLGVADSITQSRGVLQVCSQKLDRLAHSRLDGDCLNVVPASLQKGSQEIQTHQDVSLEFIIGHLDVSNGGGEAGNLFELEFDGGAEIFDLSGEGLVVGDDLGESLDSV